MAKIVDPDQILNGTEVVYSTAALTVQYLVAGNLNDAAPGKTSGVTGQAAYSASKDHILASATLRRHRSPYDPVFDASYLVKDGWDFADQQSRDLLRDAGFRITGTGQELAAIIGLQETGLTDQLYYQQILGFTSAVTNFDKTGNLNELVEIYDGAAADRRDFLKVFNRIQGKAYAEGNLLIDQDLAALTFIAYRLPLGNGNDPNILQGDAFIDANTPYTGMTLSFLKGDGFTTWANTVVYPAGAVVLDPLVNSLGSTLGQWFFTPAGGTSSGTGTGDDVGVTDWEPYAGERQIGLEWYAFNRIIDGNNGTDTQVYEWNQRILRLGTDINDNLEGGANQNAFGAVNGEVARRLSRFEGGLKTFGGTFIDNLDPTSRATAEFFDITVDGGGLDVESVPVTSTGRTFPFSAAGNLVFSNNAVLETNVDTFFDMYFDHTRRDTAADVAMTAVATNTGTVTSTIIDLSIYTAGDWVALSGFTSPANNGLFQVTGVPTAGSMDVSKTREPNDVLVADIAGPSVNVDDDPFNTDDAVIVNDDTGTPISGQITQVNEPFTFAYDTNVQGGRVAGTDAAVVVVAQGLNDSKWAEAAFTIPRSVGLVFPVNLLDDSVYFNPP